jgi:signal peptidase I
MGYSPSSGDPQPESASYRRGRFRVPAWIGVASVLAATGWAFLRYRPSRVEIEGPSMAPTLIPGDWVIVVTPSSYRSGDVVVVEHPGRPGYEMVKRIVAVPSDVVGERQLAGDEYWVEGDGPASTDSRHFGPVTREALKARAEVIYRPRDRWKRVR